MTVDFENELLLITAASGKQSTHLIPHVLKQWKHIRLQVTSQSSKDRLEKQYADHSSVEVVQADMTSQQDCHKLLEGVTACFLITPGFNPHETMAGYNIIDAALAQPKGQFKHLLYSSVIHPILRKLINHDAKRYIEEYLVESGLSYTIVQPTVLMENLPIAKLINEDNPTHFSLWNPDTQFSFVSCRDVGEASANILAQREKHSYATYQLIGTPSPLTHNDISSLVSDVIGKEVKLEQKLLEEGVKLFSNVLTHGESPEDAPFATTQGCARMFMYYNEKGLLGNPNVLEMVLGKKPLGYEEWVKVNLEESKGGKGGRGDGGSDGGEIARSTATGLR